MSQRYRSDEHVLARVPAFVAVRVGELYEAIGHRLIVETYGERSTVLRASQRILRSFSDWEVLEEMSARGVY